MTDSRVVPAGWYPDPTGPNGQRWWDGAQWTEHMAPLLEAPPYDGGAERRVAVGTPVDTVWIWLVVAVPFLPLLLLLGWDLEGALMRSMDPTDPLAPLAMYLDPFYLGSVVLGWAAYGLAVWFSYLDATTLRRLGYARQFHWAWSFLSSVVYVIGRSVVVRQQAGRGAAPMWAAIASSVVAFVVLLVWIFAVIADVFVSVISSYPSM